MDAKTPPVSPRSTAGKTFLWEMFPHLAMAKLVEAALLNAVFPADAVAVRNVLSYAIVKDIRLAVRMDGPLARTTTSLGESLAWEFDSAGAAAQFTLAVTQLLAEARMHREAS